MARDMTTGQEWKHILLFSLPLLGGNLLQQLYSLADSLVAGNLLGEGALSSIGLVFPITMLLLALAIGLSNGCGVMAAQYFGAGDRSSLRRTVSTGFITMLVTGVLVTVVGLLTAGPLLRGLLQTPQSLYSDALLYLRIYCLGLIFQFAYNAFAAFLRALGDSRSTLYFLLIATALNVVLDLLLARPMGVAGIALATCVAQAAAALLAGFWLFRKFSFLRPQKGEFRPDPALFRLTLKLGIPSILQQCAVSFGTVLMQRIINSFGPDMIAAASAAVRIESFIMCPIMSFYMGLSSFTGQNMGAGRIDRVRRGYRRTMLMALAFCGLIIVLVLALDDPIIGLFSLNPVAHAMGVEYIHTLAACFIIFCVLYVHNGVLQGSGDVVFPALASMTSLATRLVTACLMAAFTPLGYRCVFLAIPVGWALAVTIVIARYLSGRWQKKRIAGSP